MIKSEILQLKIKPNVDSVESMEFVDSVEYEESMDSVDLTRILKVGKT